MKKWWYLSLLTLFWAAVGLFIYATEAGSQQSRQNPSPDRIVSMAPNLTEILFALGLGDKIAAVTIDSDFPPDAMKKPKAGSFWQPNIEAIIAARPQLVITLGFDRQRDLADRLMRIGCQSLTVNIEGINEFFEAIDKIGAATARQAQARMLADGIKTKLDSLARLVGSEKKVRVLYVVQRQPLRVAGPQTFISEMIALAGGENVITCSIGKYPPISAEHLYACGAEVIIEPTMGYNNIKKQQQQAVEFWSRFHNLPAVKNNRIYVVDADTICRLGPRLHSGVETIARCLRPEIFSQ